MYSIIVGGNREILRLRITQDSTQGRARLTDCLTHSHNRSWSLQGRWAAGVSAHYFSACVYLGESKREGDRGSMNRSASPAPNEAITAPSFPSAIQKHWCPFSHMTPAAQSRSGVMARDVRVIVCIDTHKWRWPQQKIYLALAISVC